MTSSAKPLAVRPGMTRRISVVVSTHERAGVLSRALEGLAQQDRPADEVVVCDSSTTSATGELLQQWHDRERVRGLQHVRSHSKALPWNRWLGFQHCTGEIVLFLDDDVRLEPSALEELERVWALDSDSKNCPAGVGFLRVMDDGRQPMRHPTELRERWLGMRAYPSGAVTSGGIPVPLAGVPEGERVRTEYLWGGAMSYRRDVLQSIGLLDKLVALYERGVGRGEDVVLSTQASRYGALYVIPRPLAFHPRTSLGGVTPYPLAGWRLGLANTWGKAHTLRWASRDRRGLRRDATRVISLEVARALIWVLRRPMRLACWLRVGGASVGALRTVWSWRRIPITPGHGAASRGWFQRLEAREQAEVPAR